MNPAFRSTILVVHRWTGMTVGLVFLMLAITAAILVFRPQLEPALSPRLFVAAQCAARASIDDQVASAACVHPGVRMDDIRIRASGEPNAVRFQDRELLYVDQCTAEVVGRENKYGGFFGFSEQLHRFKFIPGEPGAILDGIVTLLVAIVLVAGGIIVWWPSTRMAWKGGFTFRPHLKGVAFLLNLHNTVGIYTCVLVFITAVTALPISFPVLRDGLNSITTSQRMQRPKSTPAPGAATLSYESHWQRALVAFPATREAILRLQRKPDDAIEIYAVDADAPHFNARSYIHFDAYTGRTLSVVPYAAAPLGTRIYYWIVAIHVGGVGGPIVQFLFLLGMLGTPVLAYTGIASWLKRRAHRAAHPAPMRARVSAIRRETDEIKVFSLVRTDGKPLAPFTAGAHVSVDLPDGLTRPYSLVNGPAERDAYHIAVKREPNSRGGSRVLHERVAVGDSLGIAGPRNHFPLDRNATRHVLLAGGIGITPLYSMARHLLEAGSDFELRYFTRSPDQTAFHRELSAPEFAGKVAFHYALEAVALRALLRELLRVRPGRAHLYICGPRPFMDLVEDLAKASWPDDAVHREYFGADPAASSGPRAAFEVELARSRRTIAVSAEKTILEALAEAGVRVVSSCSQGVCGTCITGLLGGAPDHRDAFLSEKERKACDRIMLCVSRAKGERLVLDL